MLGYLGYPGAKSPNLDSIIKSDAVAFILSMAQTTSTSESGFTDSLLDLWGYYLEDLSGRWDPRPNI